MFSRAMAEEKDPLTLLSELAVPSSHPQLGLPTWLRGAIWKGCNEIVLSGPEVGLLSWYTVPSLPSPEEAVGRRKRDQFNQHR